MRGFILQPTYRIESGHPVVHLYGRLESGDPFLVRDDTLVPHFFVRAADSEKARGLGASRIRTSDLKTMRGESVARVEVVRPAETPPLRDRLEAKGVSTYEADVRFAMRFLIDRGIKGSMEIEAAPQPAGSRPSSGAASDPSFRALMESEGARTQEPVLPASPRPLRTYERPILSPCEWAAKLRVLSFDIETDPRARRVHAISLHGCGLSEVLYVRPPASGPAQSPLAGGLAFEAAGFADEASLLRGFVDRVAAADPDVLTGWNVIDFDLRVLESAGARAGVPLRLGRTAEPVKLRLERRGRGGSRAEVAGRVVLDGIDLLRGAFVRLPDFRLETAAREILGRGKLIASRDRAAEIDRIYREDLPRFLEYAFTDSLLVTGILDKTGVVDLAVKRSLLTGMPPDRVSASIASFDSLYLGELRHRGHVAPSVGSQQAGEGTLGGAVLEPVTGLHDNVLLFDFRSLYPSLIRTYNIDPLGLVDETPAAARKRGAGEAGEPIRAPNGALFRREPGILPGILDRLFGERAAARARGDAIASQAIKILMNSCYGVLATSACRFHSPKVANAITHFGQATLMWTKERAEKMGYDVLYGDTDSIFVAAGVADPDEARAKGAALVTALNRALADEIRETFGLRSHLELQFEKLFLRLFLPSVRHGTEGARKRYAGLVDEKGRREVHFVGMEIVRRDWTELSKIFQRGLFERVFRGEDPAPYVRGFVADLRAGRHDDHLVYRKALRKSLSEYTATTPPHVKAARLMQGPPPRLVEYVMTVAGPEPAAARAGGFDYAHYLDHQLRPVADSLLTHLGLSFSRILGEMDATDQLALF